MAEIISRASRSLVKNSGSVRITVPSEWLDLLQMDSVDEVEVAMVEGKHGLFLAAWSEEQKSIDEIKEENSEVL